MLPEFVKWPRENSNISILLVYSPVDQQSRLRINLVFTTRNKIWASLSCPGFIHRRKSTPQHSPHDESTLKPRKVFVSFLGKVLTHLPVLGSSLWRPNNMTYFGTELMTLACERQWQDLDRCCSQVWPLPARQPPAQRAVSAIKSHFSFSTKHFSSSCGDVGLHWWGVDLSVMQIAHV